MIAVQSVIAGLNIVWSPLNEVLKAGNTNVISGNGMLDFLSSSMTQNVHSKSDRCAECDLKGLNIGMVSIE